MLELPHYSQFNSLRMNLPSLLLATLVILLRPALDVEEPSLEDADSVVEEEMPGAAEANSNELEDVVDNKVTAATIPVVEEVVRAVGESSAGKIMTSHKETAMHLSTLSQTGKCWRRLILTVWLS